MTVDNDRGYAFQYDHDNRLTKVQQVGIPNVDLMEWSYDALGRRIEQIDYSTNPATTTRFVYDGQNVVAEYVYNNPNWDRARYYIHG